MKRFVLLAIASLALTTIASAQDKSKNTPSLRRDPGQQRVAPTQERDEIVERVTVTQTPDMWFYEQERSRWQDPQESVRRKAEFRSSQRAQRIASSHWYGMSNSRPAANATPLFSTYSPTWVSSSFDPYRWTTARDTSATTVIVR